HHNEFKFVTARNPEKFVERFVARRFDDAETVVLSSEEISSFYHLPTHAEKGLIGARWHESKQVPAPVGLSPKGILIGENEFQGEAKPIFISDKDRKRHMYIVGEKNTGKSTLLGNMIIQDIEKGEGVVLIDPKGKLAEAVLGRMPENRAEDVVYLSMADATR